MERDREREEGRGREREGEREQPQREGRWPVAGLAHWESGNGRLVSAHKRYALSARVQEAKSLNAIQKYVLKVLKTMDSEGQH